MNKVYANAEAALKDVIADNQTLAVGGLVCVEFRKN